MLSRVFAGPVLLLALGQCFGASVATVSSRGAVTVSGIQVPTERLISWPLSATDEIATSSSPAVIRFADGSALTLQRNSRIKLESSAAKFSLLSGAAIYDGRPRASAPVAARAAASMGQITPASVARYNTATALTTPPVPEVYTAMYRAPGSQQYYISPNALSNATFVMNPHADGGPVTGTIILPSGVTIQVTETIPAGGGTPTIIITSISVPTSVPGQFVTISDPALSPLIGASVGVTSPPQGGTTVTIAVTPVGSTTPVSAETLSGDIQTGATASLTPAQKAAGETVATPSPSGVGTFSTSAP